MQRPQTGTLAKAIDATIVKEIHSALAFTDGDVAAAAKKLGIARGTLYRYLRRYAKALRAKA